MHHRPPLSQHNGPSNSRQAAIAKLKGKEFEYLVRQKHLVIGRNSSSRGDVDVNMGHSAFISRRHIEIFFEETGNFTLICNGKNGIFVDEAFHRKGTSRVQLAKTCCLRFPSTNTKLFFQSLVDDPEWMMDTSSASSAAATAAVTSAALAPPAAAGAEGEEGAAAAAAAGAAGERALEP